MSADNGIYILRTDGRLGPEYRVVYAHAIGNIFGKYSPISERYEGDNEQIKNYFTDSKPCYTMSDAWDLAETIAADFPILEDGICLINYFNDRGFLFT